MLYFCEHLEKIKVCHLHVQLDSVPDSSTSLIIFDRKTLTLRHACRSYAITLPASIDVAQRLNLKFAEDTANDTFSVRIKAQSSLMPTDSDANPVPLSDPATLSKSTICCASCQTQLLPSKLRWRSSPSEHWQEMMDSWHCHAGVSHRDNQEHHEQYTLPKHIVHAAQGIVPVPERPFVGLSHFLVHRDDLGESLIQHEELVQCRSCKAPCGTVQEEVVKLYKQAITTNNNESVDALVYFSADLLAQVEAHAVHRFLVTPYGTQAPDQAGLLIWLMTLDMRVTTSSHETARDGQRAIKVLYKTTTLAQIEGQGQTQQEVECIPACLPGLYEHLQESLERHFIQAGRQVTGEWQASYLPRY
ncbi:ubiquitin-conjugating enzyme E2-binding protein [Protomyces lactucae-debilis]|uniref:Ubiquitin-conjugating enzyme E2-binding protein n=1 Tax=Protomyces lactucae-debilis TaxID=2754530 RepID=A0A1Y2EVX8_PROLT|nr:ubiquitin-conjugating enzyme E2-binding protein [Protomyces lactucae-debilis]ORY75762.1 ubiquitin-conjugating enzyme E2-binding protein [Protomyces lactucae-debilis]